MVYFRLLDADPHFPALYMMIKVRMLYCRNQAGQFFGFPPWGDYRMGQTWEVTGVSGMGDATPSLYLTYTPATAPMTLRRDTSFPHPPSHWPHTGRLPHHFNDLPPQWAGRQIPLLLPLTMVAWVKMLYYPGCTPLYWD